MSTPTSTQQAHPVRASRRTAAQTILSVILVLGVVAPLVAAILADELGEHLPASWLAWIAGAAALIAAVSAALARIMAIPAVDAWLRHLGLSSTPIPPPTAFAFTGGEAVKVRASGLVGTVVGGSTLPDGELQYRVHTAEGTSDHRAADLTTLARSTPPGKGDRVTTLSGHRGTILYADLRADGWHYGIQLEDSDQVHVCRQGDLA